MSKSVSRRQNIAIIGAGGMGALFGSILQGGGMDVLLVDVDEDHVAAIRRSGLHIRGFGGERTVRIDATCDAAAVADRDLLLFQCKANNTSDAARAVRPHLAEGTVCVSLQNGLGNEEVIADEVGAERVLGGLTTMAGLKESSGVVRDFSRAPTYIGELAGGLSERSISIAEVLTGAGLETHARDDIRRDIWTKLLSNIAMSALSGATNRTQVEVLAVPELRETSTRALDEALRVAEASGITLDRDQAMEALGLITAPGGTGENKSSLCTDLLNKRPTEVDFIYGSAIQLGRKYEVPTPTLETLRAIVKGLERNNEGNA